MLPEFAAPSTFLPMERRHRTLRPCLPSHILETQRKEKTMSLTMGCQEKGNLTLVTVTGRMDAVTAPDFEKTCQALMQKGKIDIVAELSALDYISSAGLRSILSAAKKLRGKGGNLRFCGLSGMVKEVFKISGFQSMFTIVENLAEIEG